MQTYMCLTRAYMVIRLIEIGNEVLHKSRLEIKLQENLFDLDLGDLIL